MTISERANNDGVGACEPPGSVRTVCIVAENSIFREGLEALLNRDPEVMVVGHGKSERDAFTVVGHLRPNVLLISAELRQSPVTPIVTSLRRTHPATIVIILAARADRMLAHQLWLAGASGCVTNDTSGTDLARLVRTSTAPATRLELASTPPRHDPITLTGRELEVLRLVSLAHSNKSIGRNLVMADGTVKRHLSNIFAKLKATSRLDAVRRAEHQGILS